MTRVVAVNRYRVITPIKVAHELVAEVYFSVWGEDDTGRTLPSPGPGGLRVLRATKPIILPSCGLIPGRLAAPNCKHAKRGNTCI